MKYTRRIRTVGKWMKKTGYAGEVGSVLKDYADVRRKKMAAVAA
jgi:hypothetical protein